MLFIYMKDVVGYVLAGLGLVLLAVSFMNFAIPGLDSVPDMYILGAGVVLILAGVYVVYSSQRGHKSKGKREIPIYEGRQVVGYRRE